MDAPGSATDGGVTGYKRTNSWTWVYCNNYLYSHSILKDCTYLIFVIPKLLVSLYLLKFSIRYIFITPHTILS